MIKQCRNVGIIGVGSYVPERVMTNCDLEKIVETNDEWIRTRTGISERRIAEPEQATSDLAAAAAQRALADAGVKAEEIDLIICATLTPDMFIPSTACIVQERIGAVNAAAFDLGAACSGYAYGLATATQFIAAGMYEKVLVIGAETMSRLIDWQDRNTCVLFGDGAGAAILAPVDGTGMLAFELGADGEGGKHLMIPAGGSRLPASAETVAQRLHAVKMNGPEVFKFAVRIMGEAVQKALVKAGLTPEQIDYFVPHQANIRIIEAAAKRLELPMEKVFLNVDRYGNTSAASLGIALDEAVHSGKIKQGNIIALVGFGAGLTWAAAILKWTKGE